MFGSEKEKKIIHVEFYKSGQEKPFVVSDVPLDQLPDTFEIETTMYLEEDEWNVIDAIPKKKSEFRKTGKVNIILTKYETGIINTKEVEILYFLPTISNDIAAVENVDSLENVLVMREDDWRQFEFISMNFKEDILKELQSVGKIYREERKGYGFKNLHVRELIEYPLYEKNLSIKTFTRFFKIKRKYRGVAFDNAACTIINGFALYTSDDWCFWGQLDNQGKVSFLCLHPTKESNIETFYEKLDTFLAQEKLYFLDWPNLFLAGPKMKSFKEYKSLLLK